jgi:hypothetical protein
VSIGRLAVTALPALPAKAGLILGLPEGIVYATQAIGLSLTPNFSTLKLMKKRNVAV